MRSVREVSSGRRAAGAPRSPFPIPPSGMTLVELLVVIVLISTLVATAIPVISPGGEGRQIREASRNVNAYLQGAQARAVQTGRPFGVALERLSAETEDGEDNAVCVRMSYVEVPPTYAGFTLGSRVRLALNPFYDPLPPTGDTNNIGADDVGPVWLQFVARGATATANLPIGWQADLVPTRFLRPGDTVEVAGERFVLQDGDNLNTLRAAPSGYFEPVTGSLVSISARPANSPAVTPASEMPALLAVYDSTGGSLRDAANVAAATAPFWTEPKPYKVFRQPVSAGGEPYELPSGSAIDLRASVIGGSTVVDPLYDLAADYDNANAGFRLRTDPILVLFRPSGTIDRVYGMVAKLDDFPFYTVLPPTRVTTHAALCVARREDIPGDPVDPPSTVAYAEPIQLPNDTEQLTEAEAREVTDKYTWLNLDTRWVVASGQTGLVFSAETTAPRFPQDDVVDAALGPTANGSLGFLEQLTAATENARTRTKTGGR